MLDQNTAVRQERGRRPRSSISDERGPSDAEIDAVMLAARALVALSAQSVAALEDEVTLPQLRVLVMLASRGRMNLNAVARGLGVHPSNATRACDGLVGAGLISRQEATQDRRNVVLDLTPAGRALVDRMNQHRRRVVEDVLSQLRPRDRRGTARVLHAFAAAAGEVPEAEAWSLGWTTSPRVPPSGDHGEGHE
jgi:DNA-binding MarR family transcriptional regulator